jgi:23S rRNA (uracil1939-C5)-methyltransferase
MILCTHFGTCGGCSLQDVPPADYAAGKRAAVQAALMQAGVNAEVLAPVIVPPKTRRRAVFKIRSLAEGLHIGFHGARSHTVIDMHQCEILTPGLFALVGELRRRLEPIFSPGEAAELHVAQSDIGFDAAFLWKRNLVPGLAAQLATAFEGAGIARLTLNGEIVFETSIPAIMLGDITVRLPSNTFLQSTAEGERALQERVLKIAGKAKSVADLFSGIGTFALPLARKARVHAVEQDAPALAALAAASKASGLKPVTTEKRDLFKVPLMPVELNAYDAVVLDPPRAGAEAQVRTLAKSKVPVIAYVSCDAASFARDAATLIAGGYKMGAVTPIDQFLWSSHIELVGEFRRGK